VIENNEPSVSFWHNGKQEIAHIEKEGESGYWRWPRREAERHPLVQAAIPSGDKLNNVWLVREGNKLIAKIRVSKRTGGFAIAATITLGAIVAKAIHDHNKSGE
jgi:hypothetical protein